MARQLLVREKNLRARKEQNWIYSSIRPVLLGHSLAWCKNKNQNSSFVFAGTFVTLAGPKTTKTKLQLCGGPSSRKNLRHFCRNKNDPQKRQRSAKTKETTGERKKLLIKRSLSSIHRTTDQYSSLLINGPSMTVINFLKLDL